MSEGRLSLDGKNYFGIGMNFPFVIDDRIRMPGLFKIEYTHFFEDVFVRPSFGFNPFGDGDADCVTVNEHCSYGMGEKNCEGDTTCTKEGRKTIGGGLDVGIIAKKWEESYLAFGVDTEIGKYFSAKGNDHPNSFLNGVAFAEFGIAAGPVNASLRTFGGVQYEMGDRDEAFPLIGGALVFGFGGPADKEQIDSTTEVSEKSESEKPEAELSEEEKSLLKFLGKEPFSNPGETADKKASEWKVSKLETLKRFAVIKWKQMFLKGLGSLPQEFKTPVSYEDFAKALGLKPDATLQEITGGVEATINILSKKLVPNGSNDK